MKLKRNLTAEMEVRHYKGNDFLTRYPWFAIVKNGSIYNFEKEPVDGTCFWIPTIGSSSLVGTIGEEYPEWKDSLEYIKGEVK